MFIYIYLSLLRISTNSHIDFAIVSLLLIFLSHSFPQVPTQLLFCLATFMRILQLFNFKNFIYVIAIISEKIFKTRILFKKYQRSLMIKQFFFPKCESTIFHRTQVLKLRHKIHDVMFQTHISIFNTFL